MILKNGNNIAPNIAHHYKLDTNGDDYVNTSDMTSIDISHVVGKINNGAQFNGTTSRMYIPGSLSNSSTGTIGAWIYLTGYNAANRIFNYGFGDSSIFSYEVRNNIGSGPNTARLAITYRDNSFANFCQMYDNDTPILLNTWYYVTWSSNGSQYQLTVNGKLCKLIVLLGVNHGKWLNTLNDTPTSYSSIGCLGISGAFEAISTMIGTIDEFSIWERQLSINDTIDLYNNGIGLNIEGFRNDAEQRVLMQNSAAFTNSLFSYYPMQNNSNDVVGSNNGTDTSISYVSGKIDQAAQYTPSSNINVGAMPELSGINKLSIAFWAKSPDLFFPYWIYKLNCFQIRYDGSYQYGVGVYIYESSGADYHYTRNVTRTMTPGKWSHIVVTYDGTEALDINKLKIYIDAVQCVTEQPLGLHLPTMPTTINASVNDLFIGSNLTGNMDEVGFWNRILSSADVLSLYNGGVGLTYPFYNAVKVSNPFILDQERNAKMAYSVRKLRSKYRGYCLRVRRSNDDAEIDIGFDWKGDLDTTSLMTFVGNNSAYVVTWYDQSESGLDATQIVNANQPQIVNAGVLITRNNKPAIYSDTNSKYLETPLTNFLKDYSLIGVVQFNTTGTEWLGGGGNNYGIYQVNGSGTLYHGYNSTLTGSLGTFAQGPGSISLNIPNVLEIHRSNTVISNAVNGIVSGMFQIGPGSVNEFLITNLYGESAGYRLIGYLQETICYDTNKINTRTGIYKNIKNYYN